MNRYYSVIFLLIMRMICFDCTEFHASDVANCYFSKGINIIRVIVIVYMWIVLDVVQ